VLLGLGSGISYAIYVLLSGHLQKDVRPISSALYVITFGAIALSLFHQPPYGQIRSLTEVQTSSIIGLAVICTIIPLTLELAALQKLRSKEVALLMMIEPITAAIMGALIYHETLSLRQLVGALLIALALVINTVTKKSSQLET
jgi:drug/metabolite transporter (DMT)-like permease